jgi:hypothetical protein
MWYCRVHRAQNVYKKAQALCGALEPARSGREPGSFAVAFHRSLRVSAERLVAHGADVEIALPLVVEARGAFRTHDVGDVKQPRE